MTRIRKLNCLLAFTVLAALIAAPVVQAQTIADAKTKVDAMPDDPPRHYNLGIAYYKAGQYSDAIGAFQKAVELKADYKEAFYNLGLSQEKARQTSNAIKSYLDERGVRSTSGAGGLRAGPAETPRAIRGGGRDHGVRLRRRLSVPPGEPGAQKALGEGDDGKPGRYRRCHGLYARLHFPLMMLR